jgi:hypothetical protein
MKLYGAIIVLAMVALFFSGCNKATNNQAAIRLIHLKNPSGTPYAGANVSLFSSLADLVNSANQTGLTQVSNVSGDVTFANLNQAVYYWRVRQACATNLADKVSNLDPLFSGNSNFDTSTLYPTGYLQAVNNAANPYRLRIDPPALHGTVVPSGSSTLLFFKLFSFQVTAQSLPAGPVYPYNAAFAACGDTAKIQLF